MNQVSQLQKTQAEMQSQMSNPPLPVPPRGSQLPVSGHLQSFAKMVGIPPKVKGVTLSPPPPKAPTRTMQQGVDTGLTPQEEAEEHSPKGDALARAMLEQSRALSVLVSQMQQSDPLLDQAASSGITPPDQFGGGSSRLLDGNLFRKVRGLWRKQRSRAGAIQLGPHVRCGPELRHGGHEGALGSFDGIHRTGRSGQWSLGIGVPIVPAGRATDATMAEPRWSGPQGEGICASVPAALGHGGVGLHQGSRFHPIEEARACQESKPVGACERPPVSKEEEVSSSKTRSRRRGRLKKPSSLPDPLSCSSSSVRVTNPNTGDAAIYDRGDGRAYVGLRDLGKDVGGDDDLHTAQRAAMAPEMGQAEFKRTKEADDVAVTRSEVPFTKWVHQHVRRLLAARTPFSYFLLKSISSCRGGRYAASTALFPIPVPFDDVWNGAPQRISKEKRIRNARRKLVHIAVMALNYLHSTAPLSSVELLWRRPSALHLAVYRRLGAFVKACDHVDLVSIHGIGRKHAKLGARFEEVLDLLQSWGQGLSTGYDAGLDGMAVPLVNDTDELVPYRDLQRIWHRRVNIFVTRRGISRIPSCRREPTCWIETVSNGESCSLSEERPHSIRRSSPTSKGRPADV